MATLTETPATNQSSEACAWAGRETLDDATRQVKRTLTHIRNNAEDAAAEASLTIRRNPFKAVGLAACVGTMAGVLVGVSLGWYWNARR